jgi:hypothetical protein
MELAGLEPATSGCDNGSVGRVSSGGRHGLNAERIRRVSGSSPAQVAP